MFSIVSERNYLEVLEFSAQCFSRANSSFTGEMLSGLFSFLSPVTPFGRGSKLANSTEYLLSSEKR